MAASRFSTITPGGITIGIGKTIIVVIGTSSAAIIVLGSYFAFERHWTQTTRRSVVLMLECHRRWRFTTGDTDSQGRGGMVQQKFSLHHALLNNVAMLMMRVVPAIGWFRKKMWERSGRTIASGRVSTSCLLRFQSSESF